MTAAASAEATQQNGDGGQADEAAANPRFHGVSPDEEGLNMNAMVPTGRGRWVADRSRFFSFCFDQGDELRMGSSRFWSRPESPGIRLRECPPAWAMPKPPPLFRCAGHPVLQAKGQMGTPPVVRQRHRCDGSDRCPRSEIKEEAATGRRGTFAERVPVASVTVTHAANVNKPNASNNKPRQQTGFANIRRADQAAGCPSAGQSRM